MRFQSVYIISRFDCPSTIEISDLTCGRDENNWCIRKLVYQFDLQLV